MAFLALAIAVLLIVSAIRNTHGQLLGALLQDVPGFAIWGAAIFAVAVIGFIPGLKPVSRGLLALVLLVIILTNYRAILDGFQTTWQGAAKQAAPPAPGGFQGGGGSFGGGGSTGSWTDEISTLLSSDTSGASAQVNG